MIDNWGNEARILPQPEEEEIWKDIPSLPGYEASSFGRIRNIKTGHIRRTSLDKDGYHMTNFCIKGVKKYKKISRLICEAFNGPPTEEANICDHIDRCRFNNYYKNLRWVTKRESNINRCRDKNKEIIYMKKTPICFMDKNTNELIKKYNTPNEACDELGISPAQMYLHLRKTRAPFKIGYFITEKEYLEKI